MHESSKYRTDNPRYNVKSHLLFCSYFNTSVGTLAEIIYKGCQEHDEAKWWHHCAGWYAERKEERWENDDEENNWTISNIQVNFIKSNAECSSRIFVESFPFIVLPEIF